MAVEGKAVELTEELLKDAGTKNIDKQNRYGLTMLMMSLFYPPAPAITKLLLKHGANPHLPTNDGRYPIHVAAC